MNLRMCFSQRHRRTLIQYRPSRAAALLKALRTGAPLLLAVVLSGALSHTAIEASAQEKKPKKMRVILIPQEEQPLDPQPGTPQPQPGSQAPPSLPAPAPPSQPARRSGVDAPSSLAGSVLRDKLGAEGFRNFADRIQRAGCGQGAPCAHVWFDQAAPAQNDSVVRPEETRFFGGEFKLPTQSAALNTVRDYGGQPGGGVVLEGIGAGLDAGEEIGYDRKYNALVLDGGAVYFIRIPPGIFAELCRALAQEDKIGVSLGYKRLVYGALGKDSALAFDLTLADRFLGDIVFAREDWTAAYRFAGGYVPQADPGPVSDVAVFFRFNGFRFQLRQREIAPAGGRVEVSLVPLSREFAPDGNLLPDLDAIRAGNLSPQFEANARHVAQNIPYYRREQIIHRTFIYAETAALLRWLKSEGADLRELAAQIQ